MAVTDDFKVFAQFKDIPVISVSQLNRDASKKIDDGRQSSKTDLVRALGRSNISESMLVLNNIDGGFMIAPEYTSSGDKYLGILRVKIRYSAGNNNVMYLPFSRNNTIKLLEDFGSTPLYKLTLRTSPNGIGVTPSYQNTIPDLDTVQTSNINTSIFSTTVNSGSNSIGDLEAAFANPRYANRVLVDPMDFSKKLIDPMEFNEDSIYYDNLSWVG